MGVEEGRNSHYGEMTNLVLVTVYDSQGAMQKTTSGCCPVVDLIVSFCFSGLAIFCFLLPKLLVISQLAEVVQVLGPDSGPVFSLKREAESAEGLTPGRTRMLLGGVLLTRVCLLICIMADT